MPFARIVHRYTDGSETEIEVGSEFEPHPDLLDELVARVLRIHGEVCETEGSE